MSYALDKFDYIIVGAGFYGAVCAERLASQGKAVLIIEKRNHIGGNSWSEPDPETGIEIHKYGSHIFHTSNSNVWKYLNQFTKFNDYRHVVWTTYKNKVYSMPINLATINNFYGLNLSPPEIRSFIEKERNNELYISPKNLEEKAISLIGRPLYEAFIKGYTIKQWGVDPVQLSPEIITRLPVRHNYNNRYFADLYEGIPEEGYGAMFERILKHRNITVKLNTDWFNIHYKFNSNIPVIYTGPIDKFFNYKYGRLEWRSIEFEKKIILVEDFQGCAVMNYADLNVPYTRIHEFKHYEPSLETTPATVIYKEYSKIMSGNLEPYYPVNTPYNHNLLKKYMSDAKNLQYVYFGGRLGSYKYMDMDDTVAAALKFVEEL